MPLKSKLSDLNFRPDSCSDRLIPPVDDRGHSLVGPVYQKREGKTGFQMYQIDIKFYMTPSDYEIISCKNNLWLII